MTLNKLTSKIDDKGEGGPKISKKLSDIICVRMKECKNWKNLSKTSKEKYFEDVIFGTIRKLFGIIAMCTLAVFQYHKITCLTL